MAAAATATSVSVDPEHVRLTHDIASAIGILDAQASVYFTISAAVNKHEDLYSTETPGYKIVSQEAPVITCPYVLHLAEGNDVVVGAIKHREGD